MIQFFKSIPFHIKSAFKSVFRHLAMSLSASSAVTITLTLLSAFLIIAQNVALFTENIESELRIHVVCDEEIQEQEELNRIENELSQINGVKRVLYSSKEEELEMMINEKGEEFSMFRGDQNPLSNAFFLYVDNGQSIDSISAKAGEIQGIKSIVNGGDSVTQMVDLFDTLRQVELVAVVILTLLAIFLIANSIKMTIYARTAEIAIMRNVGAANWFIKTPFVIEGMILGAIGAVIPSILTVYGYSFLYEGMGGQVVSELFSLKPVFPFTLEVVALLFGAGMLVGIIGSFISTTKYLRWKR